MKKILVIVNTFDNKETEFAHDQLTKHGKKNGITIHFARYSDLICSADENSFEIIVNNISLKEYTLIYLRTSILDHFFQISLCEYCVQHSIRIVDSCFEKNPTRVHNKFKDYTDLMAAGLPIIPTILADLKSEKLKIPFNYPVIIKSPNGARGTDVFLPKNFDEINNLKDKFERSVLIQKYIKNTSDIRIIVIDRKVIGAIQRFAQVDEFRNNVSLGAKVETFDVDKELEKICIEVCEVLNYDIAGIDAVLDTDEEKWKIIEVNRVPQFHGFMRATGIDIYEIIVNLLIKRLSQ